MSRRRTEDVQPDRAAAMVVARQSGKSHAQISQEFGVANGQVRKILTRSPGAFDQAKTTFAQACLIRSEQYANSLTQDKLDRMSGLQLAIASKIASQQAIELLARPSIGTGMVNIQIVNDLDKTIRDLTSAKPAPVVDLPLPSTSPAKAKA